MVEDPVCKMEVKENTKFKSRFKGNDYYFCSLGCKEKFDKSPEEYTK
jgi:YHS domain-containing protein